MAKLTKRAIDSFRHRDGWDVRWDDDIPGFGIRLYPSGKKAFVLSYRASGRKRLMVLGRYGADLTLDQARERAQKHLVQVRDGTDPIEERRRAAQGRTFGDLIESYVERHAKVHKKTWRDDEQRLNRHVPASWRGRKARSITREEIAELHDRIGRGTPYEANRLLEVLRKMFGLARIWHFTDESASNPVEGITRFKERKRKRWVTPLELPALAKAIDGEPNIYVRAAVWLYLLTGMRKEELTTAKWKDVDWEIGVLKLSETKSGKSRTPRLMLRRWRSSVRSRGWIKTLTFCRAPSHAAILPTSTGPGAAFAPAPQWTYGNSIKTARYQDSSSAYHETWGERLMPRRSRRRHGGMGWSFRSAYWMRACTTCAERSAPGCLKRRLT